MSKFGAKDCKHGRQAIGPVMQNYSSYVSSKLKLHFKPQKLHIQAPPPEIHALKASWQGLTLCMLHSLGPPKMTPIKTSENVQRRSGTYTDPAYVRYSYLQMHVKYVTLFPNTNISRPWRPSAILLYTVKYKSKLCIALWGRAAPSELETQNKSRVAPCGSCLDNIHETNKAVKI